MNLSYLAKKYNLKINGVSHFGAHLGQEVLTYKELDIKNIHLFEPQKEIFNILKAKFGDDQKVFLYNIGLGSDNKHVDINLAPGNNGLSASILDPEKHKKFYPDIKFENTENIEIKIYDELLIEKVNFLNIDVQGYELFALKGSLEALKKEIDYILIEVSREALYEDGVLINELDIFLNNLDFIRVETKWVNRFIPWGDALYIKKRYLKSSRISKSYLINFLEKFSIYYFLIDCIRLNKRIIARIKKMAKKFL